jgi:tetratricopeptide (TPR) repeat protein
MINQVLNNRYRIVKVLGSGTSGLIYLAADIRHPDFILCVLRQLKLPRQNSQAQTRLQFLLARKTDVLERLAQNHHSPEILDYFVEDQKFYLVEETLPGHPLNPVGENGQHQSEDQGVLRLQEMLEMLRQTPEPVLEQPPRQAVAQQPGSDSESLERTPVIRSVQNPQTDQSRKLFWLTLAGGAVVIVVIGLVLLFQSQNQTKAKEFYNQGIEKLTRGDQRAAIKDLDQSIQLNPNEPLAYGNRGNAHYDLKAYKAAIDDYSQMIRLSPKNASAYYNRGLAYYDMGNPRQRLRISIR